MKRPSPRQLNFAFVSSLAIFVFAETIAEFCDVWIINNPTIPNFVAYNNWILKIPAFIMIGAIVSLFYGLYYSSKGKIILVAIIGFVVLILGFVLSYMNTFSFTIEFSPKFYWTFLSGPIANLFYIGFFSVFVAILVYILRYRMAESKSTEV